MTSEIIGYNPFRAIDEFEKRMFREPFTPYNVANKASIFKTDIKEEDGKYVLEADLPGFSKDDIKLDVDNEILTISAERHSEHEDKDKAGNYIRCERSYGSYSRSFDVSTIDSEKITATYDNGVLTLDMPKKEELIPKKHGIEIS
jgi:HSP20 family protein